MSSPSDSKLYSQVKKKIYKNNPKHSAYRSGLLVKTYLSEFKRRYGDNTPPYIGKKKTNQGLSRWFREKWRNQRGEVGYRFKSDIYRPTQRISSKTPKTLAQLSIKDIQKARNQKYRTGRVNRF